MSPFLLSFSVKLFCNQSCTHSSGKIILRHFLQFKNVSCKVLSLISDKKYMTFWKPSLALYTVILHIFMDLSLYFLITSHLVSNIFKYEHHHRRTVNFHHAFFHLASLCISLVLLTVTHAKKQEFPFFHLQLLLKSSLPIIFAIHLSLKHESPSEFQCQKWRCWKSIR